VAHHTFLQLSKVNNMFDARNIGTSSTGKLIMKTSTA
jgi:hypothetical protein